MNLLMPFDYEFFRRGLFAAVLVGALCGYIGVYVVLRRMSYIGHGLSHAIFGGAVLSYITHSNFYIGAGVWALFSGALIHAISRRRWVGADAAIGVVTTTSFAIGVAIVSSYRSFTRNIEAALFGNILGIAPQDLWMMTAISLVVFIVLFMIRRQLLFSTFDPEVAHAYGISPGRIDFVFVLLLATTVLASTQTMGVTLVAAAMVIPPVIARYLTKRFSTLLVLSPIIGALCGAVGMFLSFYLDISSAATIVLTAAAVFIVIETVLILKQKFSAQSIFD
jgi:manganese/iron transport system permease protein